MDFTVTDFAPLTPGVFTATAEPASVTIGLIVGSRGALLVDTGSSPEQGRAIRDRAAQVLAGVEPSDVVITHAHFDHSYGAAGFSDLPTWGHRLLAEAARQPAVQDEAERFGIASPEPLTPSRTLGRAALVDLGGRHVELLHFGPGHTSADLIVSVPDAGVVFAGDLVEDPFPQMGSDADPAGWPVTLDSLIALLGPDTQVVPGHGPVLGRDKVIDQRTWLARLDQEITRVWDERIAADDAFEAIGEWPVDRTRAEELVRVRFAGFAAAHRPHRRELRIL